jgi:NAD(P)H-dependent FMN reductase
MRILSEGRLDFSIHESLGDLPLFDPDREAMASLSVRKFWEAIDACDVVVIASPEYAHGVTGTIKNALDWLVGHVSFAGKRVVLLNPSHRAEHADLSLREILRTMDARLIEGACLRIPATRFEGTGQEMSEHPDYAPLIRQALEAIDSVILRDLDGAPMPRQNPARVDAIAATRS